MFQRPEYTCYRAAKPIVVDGRLDDASWQGAAAIPLVWADSGAQPRQPTTVRLLWDDHYLYVAFECQDDDIWGVTTERDKDIYNQEVVEVFVDDDCDDHSYIEIEVNPLNAVLDLFVLNRGGPIRGLWGWDSPGLLTAVHVDGDPTRRGTADRSWTVELAIPMSDFMTAPHLPPEPGMSGTPICTASTAPNRATNIPPGPRRGGSTTTRPSVLAGSCFSIESRSDLPGIAFSILN